MHLFSNRGWFMRTRKFKIIFLYSLEWTIPSIGTGTHISAGTTLQYYLLTPNPHWLVPESEQRKASTSTLAVNTI